MTDNTTELPTPEVYDCQADAIWLRWQLNQVQEGLEAGLREVDDPDDQDRLKDFLETNTPWEFDLDQEYRVQITGYVLVNARSEDVAIEAVEQANWHWDHDIEPDGFEVEGAELSR